MPWDARLRAAGLLVSRVMPRMRHSGSLLNVAATEPPLELVTMMASNKEMSGLVRTYLNTSDAEDYDQFGHSGRCFVRY